MFVAEDPVAYSAKHSRVEVAKHHAAEATSKQYPPTSQTEDKQSLLGDAEPEEAVSCSGARRTRCTGTRLNADAASSSRTCATSRIREDAVSRDADEDGASADAEDRTRR